jgi:hypothetical protein
MGTGAGDNIAIQIQTTADVTGVVATRKETTALGAETTRVAKQITDATTAAAAGENSLAAATTKASSASTALTKTTAKAAGSQTTALAAVPAQAKTAANALGILSQAALSGQGSLAGMAAAAGNLATGLATVSKSAKVAAGATGIGLLITVGTIAYEIFEGFKKKSEELGHTLQDLQSEGRGLSDAIGGDELGQRLEQINHAAEKEIRQLNELSYLQKEINKSELESVKAAIRANALKSTTLATQEHQRAMAKEQAGLDVQAATSAEQKYQAQLKLIKLQGEDQRRRGLKGSEAAETGTLLELQRPANEALIQAQTQANQLATQRLDTRAAEKAAITAQYDDEIRGLDQMVLKEGMRDELKAAYVAKQKAALGLLADEIQLANESARIDLMTSSTDRDEQFRGRLAQIEAERDAQIKAGVDVVVATQAAEQKRQQIILQSNALTSRSWAALGLAMERALVTAIGANQSLGKVLTATLLSPIVKELQALAESEALKAGLHFLAGDLVGGAAHTAGAALAAAAAAKIAAQGGLNSSGGGGNAAAAAAAAGPNYSPVQGGGGGGSVTVNLYTVDPTSGAIVNYIGWRLQRQGVLKQPLVQPINANYGPTVRFDLS